MLLNLKEMVRIIITFQVDAKNERKSVTENPKGKLLWEQVNEKTNGECFGYDGLMNKKYRSSTVNTLDDTHFFVLSEENFDKCFGIAILKAEIERKEFLIEKIPAFRKRQDLFYKRFKYIISHVKYI